MSQQRPVLVVLTLIVGTSSAYAAYDDCYIPTRLDARWTRKCRNGQFISSLDSAYQRSYGDRIWQICCRNLPIPKTELLTLSCSKWTGYQNNFRANLTFTCPNNGFINGIKSFHSDKVEDRKFKFRCCSVQGFTMSACKNWGVNNMFQAKSTFRVEDGRVLTGMSGFFSSRFKDRVFENTDCLMQKT